MAQFPVTILGWSTTMSCDVLRRNIPDLCVPCSIYITHPGSKKWRENQLKQENNQDLQDDHENNYLSVD